MPPAAPQPTLTARRAAGAWLLAAALVIAAALAVLALGPIGLAVAAPALAALVLVARRPRPRARAQTSAELVLHEERERLEVALRDLAGERETSEALQRMVSSASAQEELAPLAAALLDELLLAADAHAGALYVLDERDEQGSLTRVATSGLDGATNVPDRIIPNAGLAGRTAAEGRPALARHGETGIELATFAGPVRVHHELHLPVLHQGRVLAVASLARLGEPGFPDEARARLARLSGPAALALAGSLAALAARRSAAAYDAVLESAPDAYAAIDAQGVVVAWSARAEELFGHPRVDAIGEALEELIVPRHLRHRFRRMLEESCAAGSRARSFEFSAHDRRGASMPIELSLAAARERDGEGPTLHGFLRDMRDQAAADRARELQRAVGALVRARRGEALMDELLELLSGRLEAPLALWWSPASDAPVLRCEAFRAEPGLDDAGALRHRATAPQPFADGLAARAWDAEEPVGVRIDSGLEGLDAAPRAAALAAAGLRSMLAVPVAGPDGPLGVIELARREQAPPPGPMLDALTTIGVLAGHALAAGRASGGRAPFGSLGQPVPSRADAQGADSDLAA